MFSSHLSLWLCLLVVSGCSLSFPDAYTGPFRSPNEVGVVSGQSRLIGEPGYMDVVVNSVDGKRAIGGWKAPRHEVHILPGSHSIGLVQASIIAIGGPDEEFKDEVVLRFKVIVGARYALGYNPTTNQFAVVRVGLGPVPFKIVK